jgi:hypothetical protein
LTLELHYFLQKSFPAITVTLCAGNQHGTLQEGQISFAGHSAQKVSGSDLECIQIYCKDLQR